MSRSQVSGFAVACWRRVRQAFVQLAGWVKRRKTIRLPDRATAPAEPDEGRNDPRVRFWTEFRAGQREAEARIARRIR